MELILTFILIALGLAVLLAGIWTLLTKRAVMKGAKLYPAVFTGYELKSLIHMVCIFRSSGRI